MFRRKDRTVKQPFRRFPRPERWQDIPLINFTTWDNEHGHDSENNLTYDENSITLTDIYPAHTTCYFPHYDYWTGGGGKYKKNVEIRFGLKVTAISQNFEPMGIVFLTNGGEAACMEGMGGGASGGPGCFVSYDAADATRFLLYAGALNHNEFTYCAAGPLLGTQYYVKLRRIFLWPGAYNQVMADIYTDAEYTTRAKQSPPNATVDIPTWGENDVDLAMGSLLHKHLTFAMSYQYYISEGGTTSLVISDVRVVQNDSIGYP